MRLTARKWTSGQGLAVPPICSTAASMQGSIWSRGLPAVQAPDLQMWARWTTRRARSGKQCSCPCSSRTSFRLAALQGAVRGCSCLGHQVCL